MDGAAKAGHSVSAEPECRFTQGAPDLDELDFSGRRNIAVLDPGRAFENSGRRPGSEAKRGRPGRRERCRIWFAGATFAARWVKHNREVADVQRGPRCIATDDCTAGNVGGREEGSWAILFEAERRAGCFRKSTQITAKTAGKVRDGESERCQAVGAALGDERMGHHLEAGGGVEPRIRIVDAARSASAQRKLLAERGRDERLVAGAEPGGEGHRISSRSPCDGTEVVPAAIGDEIPGPLYVHTTSLSGRVG